MYPIRHSIVASIPACHAGDRGSIPRDGILGDLAQLVARVLSMHKVAGSIPAISIFIRVRDKLLLLDFRRTDVYLQQPTKNVFDERIHSALFIVCAMEIRRTNLGESSVLNG